MHCIGGSSSNKLMWVFFFMYPQWQVALKVRVSELRYRHRCMVLRELYDEALSHFPLKQIGIITSYRRGQAPGGQNGEGSNFSSVKLPR